MRVTVPVLLTSLVLATGPAPGEEAGPPGSPDRVTMTFCPLNFPSLLDGRTFNLLVSRDEMNQSPEWSPAGGQEPPLSAGSAIRLGLDEFRAHFGESDEWVFQGLNLRPMCGDRWVYVLSWNPRETGVIGMVTIPVLMSGTAIPLSRLTPETGPDR